MASDANNYNDYTMTVWRISSAGKQILPNGINNNLLTTTVCLWLVVNDNDPNRTEDVLELVLHSFWYFEQNTGVLCSWVKTLAQDPDNSVIKTCLIN